MGTKLRAEQLWKKWTFRERFTSEELNEALDLKVGVDKFSGGRPPGEESPEHSRFLALWYRCARFETDALSEEDIKDAGRFGIAIPWPQPTPEECDRHMRRIELWSKRQPWTREDCEEAVACGYASREQVEEYLAFIEKVRARGYEPVLYGGLDCEAVHIRNFPRTPDGGYELPCLLDDLEYQGRGLDFYDVDAPNGGARVAWIGQHCKSGKLVAYTRVPDEAQERAERVTLWQRVKRMYRHRILPLLRPGARYDILTHAVTGDVLPWGGFYEVKADDVMRRFDTREYKCVWLH